MKPIPEQLSMTTATTTEQEPNDGVTASTKAAGDTEFPANYLTMRPWVFGLFIFLVANMLYVSM
jgi:hypothetical protein